MDNINLIDKLNKIKLVNIQYDFKGLDKEIVFVDTPGLQGISD